VSGAVFVTSASAAGVSRSAAPTYELDAVTPATVDGHKMALGISWFTPGYPSLDIYLAVGGAKNTQADFWEFQPPASDFRFNGKAATLTVTVGTVAYVDLTPEVSEFGTCALNTSCPGSISWSLPPSGTLSPSAGGFFIGAPIGNVVELNRTVRLSAPYPKGSFRNDSAQVEEAAAPTYDAKTHVLSIAFPGHIKGAATITAAAVETSTTTCQASGGKSYTVTRTNPTAAAVWKSTEPVSANVVLTGRLTLPVRAKGALFAVVTSKAS
jgi:hypothetical protein